jgi:hypothetical protein
VQNTIRKLARRVAPRLAADRARKFERDFRTGLGIPDLARRLSPTVQGGPFAGLRYPPERFEEIDGPVTKLLGTYESELYPMFEAASGPFYDIGSADGYYAVGMALRGHRVTAWDTSANARDLCAEVARINGVSVDQRVLYGGEPIPEGLVLCDIEGAENELLTADVARGLPTVVVEVHEDERPGTSDRLRRAFAATHRVERIDQRQKVIPAVISGWTEEEKRRAITEFRPPLMHWLVFTRH